MSEVVRRGVATDATREVDGLGDAGARQVPVERLLEAGRFVGAPADPELDWVAVEGALEILIERRPFAITLRTPGHDRELALGFLLAEGVIESAADVASLQPSPPGGNDAPPGDRLEVTLEEEALDRWARRKVERELRITSACGACGKPSLDELWRGAAVDRVAPIDFDPTMLPRLLRAMRTRQPLFERTGGVHAAAAFDAAGRCLGVFEDVGRHNAVDKLVGSRAGRRRPLAGTIVVVSGRAGYEIVQKAAVAGAPVLVAVGAASSLAVELALASGIDLVCFAGSAGAHRHLTPG